MDMNGSNLLLAMIFGLVVVFPAPAPAPAQERPATGPTMEAKSRALLEKWRGRLDAAKLDYVVAAPFVIAGDGGRVRIAAYRDRTILAAMQSLNATYFQRPPGEPVLILLLESAGPYKRLAKEWFGDEDPPHYGYFRHDNIMLMNVGTGTGTLVHELTHALLKPDFPNVPDWFNEGLASLYEQCSLGERSIRGHENWRLPALQKAIREKKLRPLAELIQDPRFYRPELVGMNYAQARYLLFYLQEKGLLRDYYRQFRDGAKEDPTGQKTLERLLAPEKLDAFDKAWRAWVLGLEFR